MKMSTLYSITFFYLKNHIQFWFMNRAEGVMSGVLCMMHWLFKTVTSEERVEWKSKRN